MHKPLGTLQSIIRPVDPVARYRKPETLGHRPFRNKRRKHAPQYKQNNSTLEESRVDEYA